MVSGGFFYKRMINNLADLNWQIALSALDDCIEALEEMEGRLMAALGNVKELREGLGIWEYG